MKQKLGGALPELKKRLGLDRAVGYTLMGRSLSILGSIGTVLLIVHYLSKVEQGFYYTLLSLVNLQVVFELGFSFVVLQMAAHEAVHVEFHRDGRVTGAAAACDRLAAILRKTARWYLIAGLIMGATLLPAGLIFFYRTTHQATGIWVWPWTVAAIATVVLFVLNPFCSFLEGCGQVREVAAMRLAQAILAIVAAWSAMIVGRGLFSPGMVVFANAVVAGAFLWKRRRTLAGLLRAKVAGEVVSWKNEIWSFQWRIAITWLCSYFTAQVLVPILFASRGAAEAGRLGMSLSVAGYMWHVVFAWMSTKAAPFGRFIAKQEFESLDRLYFRTLWQSLAVMLVLVSSCMVGVLLVSAHFPALAARMVSPVMFALLLLTSVSTLLVQCEALYLRAHKKEPLIWQATVVAVLTTAGAYLVAPHWGISGMCVVYFLFTGLVGAISASAVFQFVRRSHKARRVTAEAVVVEAMS